MIEHTFKHAHKKVPVTHKFALLSMLFVISFIRSLDFMFESHLELRTLHIRRKKNIERGGGTIKHLCVLCIKSIFFYNQ